jgi:hypothetical protein
MTLDLTDDETAALVEHLKALIVNDPFPRGKQRGRVTRLWG